MGIAMKTDPVGVYPPDVSVGGWHWLGREGSFEVARWCAAEWQIGERWRSPSGLARAGWCYVAPCPLPDEARAVPRVFCDELGNEVRV